MTRPRALVVVTGSELVRGDRRDLNGPFLARELLGLGIEPARIIIVGDREEELAAALREGLAADVLVTSGGLGPTHDDRTVELLARATHRALRVDADLERRISDVSRTAAERLGRPYAEFEPGVRKQASLPQGAVEVGLAGTAPGLALEHDGCAIVVLPGPPRELQRLWRDAVESQPVAAVVARTRAPERRTLRFFGVSESAVAQALAEAGGERAGVETTICARDFEIHVDLVVDAAAAARADELEARLGGALEPWLYSRDERGVEEHVLALCRERGLTLATAESCTGGMVAERVTGVPGASDVFIGAIVAYADDVKRARLRVPDSVLARHGAVSAEAAAAMARGARSELGADVAVSVTGIAGPEGGTPEKPVGLVYLHVCGPKGDLAAEFSLPGDRDSIRRRATVSALHLVRRLLAQN